MVTQSSLENIFRLFRIWINTYLFKILPFFIFLSNANLFLPFILPLIYCSIIKEAIGAAHLAPKPEFSTTTAIAILGFSFGAKPCIIQLTLKTYPLPIPTVTPLCAPFPCTWRPAKKWPWSGQMGRANPP